MEVQWCWGPRLFPSCCSTITEELSFVFVEETAHYYTYPPDWGRGKEGEKMTQVFPLKEKTQQSHTWFILTFHWPESSHMTTSHCKGVGKCTLISGLAYGQIKLFLLWNREDGYWRWGGKTHSVCHICIWIWCREWFIPIEICNP